MTSRAHRLLLALALPFALIACSDDNDSPATGGPVTPPPTTSTLTGSVVKGVTANAVITVVGADGTLLATTESSDLGAYSVALPAGYAGAVRIVATAKDHTATVIAPEDRTRMRCDAPSGCTDASDSNVDFGEWFEVPLDFELSAVAYVNGWGIHLANVTPLSTLAAEWAATFPQGLDADSVGEANTTVAAMFGFALSDLEDDTNDIADPLWLNMASPKQLQLALIYATFAEIGTQMGVTPESLVHLVAEHFASQGGSLMEYTSEPAPSLSFILGSARQLLQGATLAGVIDMPDQSYNDTLTSMDTLLDGLESGEMSSRKPVSYDYLIAKLGPMGEQIDEVLTITNLKNPSEFIDAQWPYFSWLAHENNLQLIPVAAKALVAVALSSIWVDFQDPTETAMIMPGTVEGEYAVTLNIPERKLTLLGTTHGQQVDLTIGITGIADAIANGKRFNFSVAGTVSNDTASGVIDAAVEVDAKNVDFTALQAVIDKLRSTDIMVKLAALFELPVVASTYAYTMDAEIWAKGTASLVKNDDPTQKLAGNFDLLAFVDLAATGAQKLLSVDLKTADLVLPAMPGQTNHLYANGGKHVLKLDLTQDLDVHVDGAATLFGLPEAVLSADGHVEDARLLFNHARDTLVDGFVGAIEDFEAGDDFELLGMVDELLSFDFDQLKVSGNALLTIAELGHQYRAELETIDVVDDTNSLLLTVFQPASNDVAFTAELRPSQQKVHFLLGADQEPWDLRLMTTPTPRVALLGPDGQYAEVTQEDAYALLDMLQVRNILDDFVTQLFGEYERAT